MEQQILSDLEVVPPKPTNIISREDELAKIVAEVEKQAGQTALKLPARRHFNQPNLLSVSSLNAVPEAPNSTPYSLTGFNSFNVNLPLPLLDVESLQLLNANIPQASQNISDTALVFWYYRLSAYSGVIPNPNNLYLVRLLPSYYKQEFIQNATNYGFNRTFKKYSDLATELAKACSHDIGFENLQLIRKYEDELLLANVNIPFLKDAISLTYNSTLNKFQFTGIPTTPVFVIWNEETIYAINAIIAYAGIAYRSKQNANLNHIPSISGITNTTWWERLYSTEVIAEWENLTAYSAGRYVSYKGSLWRSVFSTVGFTPDLLFPSWNSITTFYVGSVVEYSGNNYTCVLASLNNVPGLTGNWLLLNWSSIQFYPKGVVILYSGNYYVAKQNNSNQTPVIGGTNYWTFVGVNFWTAATLPNTVDNLPVYNYLSTGYNDPNVQLAQGSSIQQWNPYNLYEADPSTIVQYAGRSWFNGPQTINEAPFNTDTATITSAVAQKGIATFRAPNFFTAGQVIQLTGLTPSAFNGVYRITNCDSGSFSVVNLAFTSLQTFVGSATAFYPIYDGGYFYKTGDVVVWDINSIESPNYYIATADTIGQNPAPLFRNWRIKVWYNTADAPRNIGLTYASSLTDFVEVVNIDGSQYLLQPFPAQIPGQPSTPSPKRLLNTVLGFTFNGTFNPLLYQNINSTDVAVLTVVKTNAPYINLLRPVPRYVALNNFGSPETLGAVPTQALTYTADGYCNLVFSSVIYIYSTIVLGSSVDTQRTSNLLAVMPLACGNLGITFGANFIDNPMTKVSGDLYTVGIELFNEYAEPYYLTNNAVATFLFKMTYKSAEKVVQNIL